MGLLRALGLAERAEAGAGVRAKNKYTSSLSTAAACRLRQPAVVDDSIIPSPGTFAAAASASCSHAHLCMLCRRRSQKRCSLEGAARWWSWRRARRRLHRAAAPRRVLRPRQRWHHHAAGYLRWLQARCPAFRAPPCSALPVLACCSLVCLADASASAEPSRSAQCWSSTARSPFRRGRALCRASTFPSSSGACTAPFVRARVMDIAACLCVCVLTRAPYSLRWCRRLRLARAGLGRPLCAAAVRGA